MQTRTDIDELKRNVRILDVLSRYGIEAERQGNKHMALCPFHDDHNPSLSIDPIKNVWHCFGCNAGGTVIDFVMKKEGLPFKEAVDRMLLGTGAVVRAASLEKPKPDTVRLSPEERRQVADVIEHYHRTLSGEDGRGLDYLRRRHIADPETLKTFRVGYCNGTLKKVLPETSVPTVKKIGLLRADGTEVFDGCIVVPVFTADGGLGECFARFIVDRKPTNHLYLPGAHRGVMNAKAAEVYEEIILTEAAFDALTFYAHGVKNVIPCYGTGGFTDDHRAALKNTRRVFFAFDNDQAGEDGAKRIAQTLDAAGIECHRVKIPAELGKDVNEYAARLYREGMKPEEVAAALKDLVTKAARFGFRREKSARLTLADSANPDDLVFTNCELTYRLRGLFENRDNSLRVILTASREDAGHTDRFDLYTAKSRASFTYRAAARLELPAAKIEDDLNALIPLLETLRAEDKGQADGPKGPPPMTEGERDEALRLLRSKDLLRCLSADLETVGYVGEDRNKQLAYLIATSRKLDKPLSAIIRSESGAGKSFLMECVAELMPEEEVQYFSRLTPQSLYYMGENELVHKLLIVDERDGSEEAEYPIRTLQTRRKLTLAVPMKDASTGKIKTSMLTINGPIAYMESSTSATINPENLNRCFEIFLDESEEQTRKIYALQKQAHTPEGWKVDAQRGATIRRHQNAQRLLAPVRVSIPYTRLIRFPASWTRGRRDHQRLLHLIEVVAFLHQAQRDKKRTGDGEEYIEATVEDFANAYELARTAFAQALTDIPRNARLVLSHIRAMVKEVSERLNLSERDYGFRRRDVREYAKLPDHQVKRAMRTLEELEYIHVRRGGRGGSFVYRLAADPREKDPLEGLTTPEELRREGAAAV
ncbi:MAG: toprim domain-containing protein [Bryobacterales bacterium]|nr:toprim domain-containing protein [Bryobacterales bacterium]